MSNIHVYRASISIISGQCHADDLESLASGGITDVSPGDLTTIQNAIADIKAKFTYLPSVFNPGGGDPGKGGNPPPVFIPG